MLSTIFQDLKVIELASVLAGPAVGQFFVELGAEVVKVENAKTGGDVTRRWKAPTQSKDRPDSAYYYSVNTGKQTLFMDLRQTEDREQVYTLVKKADIVISNYRPRVAQKLGMCYRDLKTLNSQLIYAELSGFESGNDRPAFDVVLQAETGFLHLTGEPGQAPVKMPVALIDLLAAHQLKEGLLVALIQRMRTGKGCHITTNLYAAALASLANQATNWLVGGYAPQRMGMAHPNIAPYGDLLLTADERYLVPAVGSDAQFVAFCQVLQLSQLVQDERFQTNEQRVIHRKALQSLLQIAVQQYTGEALLDMLRAANVPAGLVRSIPEVFAQASAQPYLRSAIDEKGEDIKVVRNVVFKLVVNED